MSHRALRTVHHGAFRADRLVEAKDGRVVTVCLPARDEGATVGRIVRAIRRELVLGVPLVDEVVVVDDGSMDATAAEARAAGARVVQGGGAGKGHAMWRGLREAEGDLVAFCDADVRQFPAGFVVGLVGPLLTAGDVSFVKGFYQRPFEGRPGEGGRVTELVAKPALRTLFPALAGVRQPLGGECAGRRDVLEQVPFVAGYGVDVALLIDVARRVGVEAVVQVDLGRRVHRNRPLAELAPQAEAVLRAVLDRAGLAGAVPQLPALVHVPGYRRRSA